MNSESFLNKLSSDKVYSRSDLQDLFEENVHKISDHTLNWLIYNLLKEEKIFRIFRDAYSTSKPDIKRICAGKQIKLLTAILALENRKSVIML